MRPQSHLKARGKLGCIQTAQFLSYVASFKTCFSGVLAGGRGHRTPSATARSLNWKLAVSRLLSGEADFGEVDGGLGFVRGIVAHPEQAVVPDQAGIAAIAAAGQDQLRFH